MTDPAERRRELRAAGILAGSLALLGALLGPVWEAWSPPGPIGIQYTQGVQPDETEAWAAGDGRFALIAIVVGALAAVLAWYLPALRRVRGPLVAVGLAVGLVVGSALTDLVGWALRGASSDYHCGAGTCLSHLPLTVHMHGLWFLAAFVAVLGYGLFVAFAVADDLGRPDRPAGAPDQPIGSVGPEHQPQDGGRYGDAAGVPQ